jgi:uncharacterized protein (UPF0332 family)
MPVSPPDLFELAQRLNSTDCDEVARRCAVSRAYYAALHQANLLFEKVKPAADGESSHAEIIGRVKSYSAQQLPGRMYASEIAKALPRLRRIRNSADYDLSQSFLQEQCDDVLKRVAHVLGKCDDVARMREQAAEPPVAAG